MVSSYIILLSGDDLYARVPKHFTASLDLIGLDELRVLVVDDSKDMADMLKAFLTEVEHRWLRQLRASMLYESRMNRSLMGSCLTSIERAQAEGFYAHLTKPLDLDLLLKTLRNIPRKN